MSSIVEYERAQVDRANETGLQPVVFVHGLWLLPTSWDRWAKRFEDAGFVALTPGWPDDPLTVEEARAHPEAFAHKTIGQVADHFEQIILNVKKIPAIVGHSFGGLIAEILAGRGLGTVSVAISPAPARGVLPLPISALKSIAPVIDNPANRNRAVPLTYDQFRYAFANAVDDAEAKELYEKFCVPASGVPVFESGSANLNPWTEATFDGNENRGPMLVIAAEKDQAVPPAIAKASFKLEEERNDDVTEYLEMPGRGHSLTIDHGWQEVADKALAFVQRFTPTEAII